jgi:8-oxo-dGTP pyrophosphatase MutT (NUDIX family)
MDAGEECALTVTDVCINGYFWYCTVMNDKNLIWTEEASRTVFDCRIFSIRESACRSPDNELRTYTVIDASDWAVTIPLMDGASGRQFVMVRQWRHGARELSLEFPGGVFEPLENPEQAAARELQEETGYKPRKIKKIGEMSPNPAIMSNRIHFFLAEGLVDTGKQKLDTDEFLETVLVDVDEVIKNMGRPPFVHALMSAALLLYLQNPALPVKR